MTTKTFLASNQKKYYDNNQNVFGNNLKILVTKSMVEIEPLSIRQLKTFD
jgi:hypothetical protein